MTAQAAADVQDDLEMAIIAVDPAGVRHALTNGACPWLESGGRLSSVIAPENSTRLNVFTRACLHARLSTPNHTAYDALLDVLSLMSTTPPPAGWGPLPRGTAGSNTPADEDTVVDALLDHYALPGGRDAGNRCTFGVGVLVSTVLRPALASQPSEMRPLLDALLLRAVSRVTFGGHAHLGGAVFKLFLKTLILQGEVTPVTLFGLRALREVMPAGEAAPLVALAASMEEYAAARLIGDLLARGFNINERDFAGRTPLIAAAGSCNPAIIEQLLMAGADPACRDASGRDALRHATEFAENARRRGAQALEGYWEECRRGVVLLSAALARSSMAEAAGFA